MLIRGACHCGNITFDLTWEPEPTTIAARACDCTFCTKHGGVWTANAASTLTVAIAQPEHVSRYEHGTRTAQFHVCTRCGVVPFVTSTIDGHLYAVDATGQLRDRFLLGKALGAAYTPVVLDHLGRVYALNNGHMFVIGAK